MSVTSISLLARLRDPAQQDQNKQESWRLFVELYAPLIRAWLRRRDLLGTDADDVAQEVLAIVMRKIRDFEHSRRPGAFRTWLKAITINCLRDYWKTRRNRPLPVGDDVFQDTIGQLSDPNSGLSKQWDLEHDRHVLQGLLRQIQGDFAPNTWAAFCGVVLEGRTPDEVAKGLGVTVNAVFIAKSRVLKRLRERGEGLLDDDAAAG